MAKTTNDQLNKLEKLGTIDTSDQEKLEGAIILLSELRLTLDIKDGVANNIYKTTLCLGATMKQVDLLSVHKKNFGNIANNELLKTLESLESKED